MLDLATLAMRKDGSVLYAAFINPPLNIISAQMASDIATLCERVDENDSVRVLVFSSAVSDFFLAHQDYGMPDITFGSLLNRISRVNAITIAQVEGRARSLGSDVALVCDMTFAAHETAIFGQIDIGLGMLPSEETIRNHSASLGPKRALEVLLSCNDFCASDAERYGWINRALPANDLEPFVCALAQRLASFRPTSLRETKRRFKHLTRAIVGNKFGDQIVAMRTSETEQRLALLDQRGLGHPGELERDFGRILAEIPPSND